MFFLNEAVMTSFLCDNISKKNSPLHFILIVFCNLPFSRQFLLPSADNIFIDKTDFPGASLGLSGLILDTMRTEHDSHSDSPVSGSPLPIQIMKLCVLAVSFIESYKIS